MRKARDHPFTEASNSGAFSGLAALTTADLRVSWVSFGKISNFGTRPSGYRVRFIPSLLILHMNHHVSHARRCGYKRSAPVAQNRAVAGSVAFEPAEKRASP